MVARWVDADTGDHHFESLRAQDVQDCIWDYFSRHCDFDLDDRDPQPGLSTALEIEAAAKQTRQRVILVASQGGPDLERATRALEWFVSGRRAWLFQKDRQGGEVGPRPAGQLDLAQAVVEFVELALFDTPPAAAGPG
jgi:hypothetical protein